MSVYTSTQTIMDTVMHAGIGTHAHTHTDTALQIHTDKGMQTLIRVCTCRPGEH